MPSVSPGFDSRLFERIEILVHDDLGHLRVRFLCALGRYSIVVSTLGCGPSILGSNPSTCNFLLFKQKDPKGLGICKIVGPHGILYSPIQVRHGLMSGVHMQFCCAFCYISFAKKSSSFGRRTAVKKRNLSTPRRLRAHLKGPDTY